MVSQVPLVCRGHTQELYSHELRTWSPPTSIWVSRIGRSGSTLPASTATTRTRSETQISGETTPEPAVNDQAEVTTALITRFETCPGSHKLIEGCMFANLPMMLAGVLQTKRITRLKLAMSVMFVCHQDLRVLEIIPTDNVLAPCTRDNTQRTLTKATAGPFLDRDGHVGSRSSTATCGFFMFQTGSRVSCAIVIAWSVVSDHGIRRYL